MRYFLEVAKFENIHRASEALKISPGSLSKAISRIEGELGIKLFYKEGRNIRLTDQGNFLKLKASQIVQLEESARAEISGLPGHLHVIMAGPEVLISKFGFELTQQLEKKYRDATFEYQTCDDDKALSRVAEGEAHLALVTADVPSGLTASLLTETKFLTVISQRHPLYPIAKSGKSVAVEKVLEYPFVSPNHPLLGKVGMKQSLDGWRDDMFPRKVLYHSTSLRLIEALVAQGKAIAYLPDYYAKDADFIPLKVTGCPYTCVQKIKLVARRPKEIGWLNQLF